MNGVGNGAGDGLFRPEGLLCERRNTTGIQKFAANFFLFNVVVFCFVYALFGD